MTRITLQHLRCFLAVAETKSFTVAASRLFVTQSSLTAAIKQFEDRLGLKLFDRTTRRVQLTETALRFMPVAHRILRDFDTAVEDLRAVAASKKGHLKLAAVPSAVRHILIPALRAFRARYPDITVFVRDGSADKIEHAVLEGEVDFGLCGRSNAFPELEYRPLVNDRFGVIFLEGHGLGAIKRRVKWSDLEAHGQVTLTSDTDTGALLRTHPHLEGSHTSADSDAASSTSSLLAMLTLGGKVAVVPALAAQSELTKGYRFRLLHEPEISRELCLVTRPVRSLAAHTTRLLDLMILALADLPNLRGVTVVQGPQPHPLIRKSK